MVVNYASVEEQYKKDAKLKKEDVSKLMEWMHMQPHLPNITELQAINFLNSCYYSNEATKTCIDTYYTTRTHVPEFFANRNPTNDELKLCMKTVSITPLPKLTPEGYCIIYARLIDPNTDVWHFNSALKLFDMCSSLYLQENGALKGHMIIVDLRDATITHVLKCSLLSMKKAMYYLQDALPFRLKAFHFVNGVSFMDKILALMRPFMKKGFMEMIKIHYGDNKTIFDTIPKECLPNDIDGSVGNLIDIYNKFSVKIMDNVQFYIDEEPMVADESKRPGKPKNAGDLYGVEGTFKTLDID